MQLRSPENISCFGHDHPDHVVPSIGNVSKYDNILRDRDIDRQRQLTKQKNKQQSHKKYTS